MKNINFVTFTPEEKTNISLMDKQHEEMSHIINKIYEVFESSKTSIVKKQLDALLILLRVHFDYEEELMKETKFGGYYSHKLEHDRFYKKIESIITIYPEDQSVLSIPELNNFRSWFHNHIEISDKKCGEHFFAKGIT